MFGYRHSSSTVLTQFRDPAKQNRILDHALFQSDVFLFLGLNPVRSFKILRKLTDVRTVSAHRSAVLGR
jgi:hypothetical protein